MDYLIAIDFSGSTGGQIFYWQTVQKIFDNYSEARCILWDDRVQEPSRQIVQKQITNRNGFGGTRPEYVAKYCVEKKIKNLVLITDGEVDSKSVELSDKFLSNYKFDHIEAHIIFNSSSCNLSVTAPFTRNSPNKIYLYNKSEIEPKIIQSIDKDDFELYEKLETINTAEEFNIIFDKLKQLIIAQNIGRNGLEKSFIKKLTSLRNRIVSKISNNSNNPNNLLTSALQTKNIEESLKIIKQMSDAYMNNESFSEIKDMSSGIDKLINLAKANLSNIFDLRLIESKFLNTPMAKDPLERDELPIEELPEGITSPECPILFEKSIMAIMFTNSKPILEDEENNIISNIQACPLRLLNYPHIVEKIKNAIGHYVSIEASQKLSINPLTREPICGIIALGNSDLYIKATNWGIARAFYGGKMKGNVDLYYAVIREICKNIDRFNDIKDQLDLHMNARLENNTYASLLGQPQFMTTNLSLVNACWWILHSWTVLDTKPDYDPLRTHIFYYNVLIDLVKLNNYEIDSRTLLYCKRLKILMSMLSIANRCNINFRLKIKALYQNSIIIKDYVENIILLDGAANETVVNYILQSFPKYYKDIEIIDLINLADLVKNGLPAKLTFLPQSYTVSEKKYEINWSYKEDYEHVPVLICANTCRPYTFAINRDGVKDCWQNIAINEFGEKYISCCSKLIEYVNKYKKYPLSSEFILFLWNKYSQTLPKPIIKLVDEIFNEYDYIFKNVSVNEFINRTNNSRSKEQRIIMEN
jgi:hypothetical protein